MSICLKSCGLCGSAYHWPAPTRDGTCAERASTSTQRGTHTKMRQATHNFVCKAAGDDLCRSRH